MRIFFGRYIYMLTFSVFIIFLGCNTSSEPDPCLLSVPVQAEFNAGNVIYTFGSESRDSLITSDTLLAYNYITFEASKDYYSYSWKIGNDPRVHTTKRVLLFFENPISDLIVSLTVLKNPDKNCFPNDDGEDTIVKHFTIIDKKSNPIFGRYIGANQSKPNDFFEIEVVHDEYYDRITIVNIDRGCDPFNESFGIRGFHSRQGYKWVHFEGSYVNSCGRPIGWIHVDKSGNSIEVDYTSGPYDNKTGEKNRVREIFIGRKII